MKESGAKQRRWPGMLRLLGAVALAIAFFLPISSCSGPFNTIQEPATEQAGETADASTVRYRYPYRMLAVDSPSSLLILGAFFWPFFALGLRKFRLQYAGIKFAVLETILCLMTGWAVWSIGYIETMEIGSYLAFAGAASYLTAASADIVFAIKRRREPALFPR